MEEIIVVLISIFALGIALWKAYKLFTSYDTYHELIQSNTDDENEKNYKQ